MADIIASVFVCSIVMSLISLTFVLICRPIKDRQSPKFRYYSWIVILVGFVTPFKYNFGASGIRVHTVPQNASIFVPNETIYGKDTITTYAILFAVWLIGAVAFFSVNMFRHMRFCRTVKRYEIKVKDSSGEFAMLCEEMGIRKKIKISIVPTVTSPMVTGIFKPKILMPDRKFDRDELRLVLRHELMHMKRGDLICKLLFIIARSLHWFNPIFILIERRFDTECELSCDEAILENESRENKKLYCRSIIDASSALKPRGVTTPVTAANLIGGKKEIKMRIKYILSQKKRSSFTVVLALIILLTVCSGALVTISHAETYKDEEATTFMPTEPFAICEATMIVSEEYCTSAYNGAYIREDDNFETTTMEATHVMPSAAQSEEYESSRRTTTAIYDYEMGIEETHPTEYRTTEPTTRIY